MNKVRVLEIVGDPVGGIRKHIHDIIKGLSGTFEFYYISSQRGDKIFFREIGSLVREGHRLVLDIRKKPGPWDLIHLLRIYRFIKSERIEVVHGHGAKGGVYARICGRLAGVKVIYTPHGGVVHSMFGAIETQVYALVEKLLFRMTDFLIFESNYTAGAFLHKFGGGTAKQVVNYNGVELPKLPCKLNASFVMEGKEVVKFGVFGVLRREKGQHLAIEALSLLANEKTRLELHFYGEGKSKVELQVLAQKKGMSDTVFLHGEVENVYAEMDSVDFILIPSLFEAFGYIAVEAMLWGKPVISSDAGGLSEVVDAQSGFVFTAGDTTDMANTIRYALNSSDSEINEKCAHAQSRAVQMFGMEQMLQCLKENYSVENKAS